MHDEPRSPAATPETHVEPFPELGASLLLVARAQNGDQEALNRLFERYYDRIYRVVRIRMGARLRSVLEHHDIVQETCAVAVRKLNDFQPRDHASLIQWLAQIAENQIRDAHDRWIGAAKRNPDRETPLDAVASAGEAVGEVPQRGPQLSAGGPGPATIAANSELKEIYDACVEALPSEQRELILLREYVGASWDEIVARTGRPNANAAQAAYQRAQLKLADGLRKRLRR